MRVATFAQAVLGGGTTRGWGRAAVLPDPVRRQGHRRAVVPSHGLVAWDGVPERNRGWPLSPPGRCYGSVPASMAAIIC